MASLGLSAMATLAEPLLAADRSASLEPLARTFATMQRRKFRRYCSGVYREKKQVRVFWCIAYCGVLGVLTSAHVSVEMGPR